MPIDIRREIKHPDGTVEIFLPEKDGDDCYTLAKPGARHERNYESNAVKVWRLEDAAELLKKECSVRMRSDRGNHGLYSPRSEEFILDDAR